MNLESIDSPNFIWSFTLLGGFYWGKNKVLVLKK